MSSSTFRFRCFFGGVLRTRCKVINYKLNHQMFIEKFTLKNNNAQYHRICVSVFLAQNH